MASAETGAPVASTAQSSKQGDSISWGSTRTRLFVALASYFALQIVVRTLLSSTADLDEADQLLLTQKWSWGYGPQPPLYTWIQTGFFNVFGVSIFGLSLFKNLLLFGIYALTYWTARFVTASHACGVAAAVSLLFLPQIAWEAQRDLTHSVLASALSLATLACFCRVVENRRTTFYLLFGLCVGLGCLSKYNYILFPVGLLGAALSLKELRPAVWNWRMLLALVVAALIFLPNGLWMQQHWALTSSTASKFAIQTSVSWLHTTARGLSNLPINIATFAGPLILIHGLVFWRAPKTVETPVIRCDFVRLLTRTLVLIVTLLILANVLFRVTGFRERWFLPILVVAPMLSVTILRRRLDSQRLKWLVGLAVAVATIVTLVMPGRILTAERLHRTERLDIPYDALAVAMQGALDPSVNIVAEEHLLGGNLRLMFSGRFVVSPGHGNVSDLNGRRLALVWDATQSLLPSEKFVSFTQDIAPADWSKAQYVSATRKFHRERKVRLGFVIVERNPQNSDKPIPP